MVRIEILWLSFTATTKFVTVSIRLILLKVRVDRFTGSQQESDVRRVNGFDLSSKN